MKRGNDMASKDKSKRDLGKKMGEKKYLALAYQAERSLI